MGRPHLLAAVEGMEGIACCAVCNGAEASLPSECPGTRMTPEVEQRVLAGALDYVGGQWVLGATRGLVIRLSRDPLPGCPIGAVDPYPKHGGGRC